MTKIKLSNKIVEMREPFVADLRAVSHVKNEEEKTYQLVSNLTGISDSELNKMKIKDFKKITEALNNFL